MVPVITSVETSVGTGPGVSMSFFPAGSVGSNSGDSVVSFFVVGLVTSGSEDSVCSTQSHSGGQSALEQSQLGESVGAMSGTSVGGSVVSSGFATVDSLTSVGGSVVSSGLASVVSLTSDGQSLVLLSQSKGIISVDSSTATVAKISLTVVAS